MLILFVRYRWLDMNSMIATRQRVRLYFNKRFDIQEMNSPSCSDPIGCVLLKTAHLVMNFVKIDTDPEVRYKFIIVIQMIHSEAQVSSKHIRKRTSGYYGIGQK